MGADFQVKATKELLELKTDSHDLGTGNFFMDRYHDKTMRWKAQGPWKAAEDGCKYFAYLFYNSRYLYMFETAPLLANLNSRDLGRLCDKVQELKEGETVPRISQGYIVSRASLKHLYKLTILP